jgi:hypothetical protein
MTNRQYMEFDRIRADFRDYIARLMQDNPWLEALQEELRLDLGYTDYSIETPIVYNKALDDIEADAQPSYIIIGDNPGKNEQKAFQRRYLVGQSGKLAHSWFEKELKTDFRSSCVILNKTPIHTAKTAEIAMLGKIARRHSIERRDQLQALLDESQRTMATFAFRLHHCLGCILWVSGYGELRNGRLFTAWAEEIRNLYRNAAAEMQNRIWVFRHFSMNQFSIEYSRCQIPGNALSKLESIGTSRRKEILGF